jgi:hypothetical protein
MKTRTLGISTHLVIAGFLLASGCFAEGGASSTENASVDAAVRPDVTIPDAHIPTLDGGARAYEISEHELIAENARAPSVAVDSRGALHIAYLCQCDPVATGNSASASCDRICYSTVDCNGITERVSPAEGIGGDTAWGSYVGTSIHLDVDDNVFVLKDISRKQVLHHQVGPNSVHRYDADSGGFVMLEDSFETLAMLPVAGRIYLVTKREGHEDESLNGIFLKAIDYDGQEVLSKRQVAQVGADTSLFVGGLALDDNQQLHIAYRIDDSTPPKTYDLKDIVFDTVQDVVLSTDSVTGDRIGDHHNITAGGAEGDLLAAAAPVGWAAGLRVSLRRLSEDTWKRYTFHDDDPRVTWNGHDSEGCDYLNPEVAVDGYDRVFVAFGGVSQDEVEGDEQDYHRCWYHGPCDCTENPSWCFYGINAYYFIVYPNGAVDPVELIRPDSSFENFQGHGEGTVELAPAWDQGVFAVYEHLEGFDDSFNVYLTPLGGAATACDIPVVE